MDFQARWAGVSAALTEFQSSPGGLQRLGGHFLSLDSGGLQ